MERLLQQPDIRRVRCGGRVALVRMRGEEGTMVGRLDVCGRRGGRNGEQSIVVRGAMLRQFGERQNASLR